MTKVGELYGVAGMEPLDRANTKNYGDPETTKVGSVEKNTGILISGHDLKDLEMLLEQTQGTGVDVYTHSEEYSHFIIIQNLKNIVIL